MVDSNIDPDLKLQIAIHSKTPPNRIILVLRWIAVLPGAILGGAIASLLSRSGLSYGFGVFRYEHPFIFNLILDNFSCLLLAGAFVFVAAWLAPRYKKIIAVVFAGIILLFSGGLLFVAFISHNYWIILQTVSLNIGSIGMAASIFIGELLSDDF